VDKEQHIEPAEPGGIDGEEVAGTAAWECRNCDRVMSDRWGAGLMPLVLRIRQTVDEAMLWVADQSLIGTVALSHRELIFESAKARSTSLVTLFALVKRQ
jgi:hypothetical protein